MGPYRFATRFFAVMLLVGGAIGLAVVLSMGLQLVQKSGLLGLPMAVLAALFAWAVYTGVQLWRGTPYGRKWAPIAYASQIPIIAIAGVSFRWFTGISIAPVFSRSSGTVTTSFAAAVGASGEFTIGGGAPEFRLGINLFALVALLILLRANKAFTHSAAGDSS